MKTIVAGTLGSLVLTALVFGGYAEAESHVEGEGGADVKAGAKGTTNAATKTQVKPSLGGAARGGLGVGGTGTGTKAEVDAEAEGSAETEAEAH